MDVFAGPAVFAGPNFGSASRSFCLAIDARRHPAAQQHSAHPRKALICLPPSLLRWWCHKSEDILRPGVVSVHSPKNVVAGILNQTAVSHQFLHSGEVMPFKSFPSLCSFSSLLKSSSHFLSAASFESPQSQSAKTSAKGFKGRISIFLLYIPK